MTDLNNSGMSDLEDVNEVLKDDTTTITQKETELGKIKQKFGRGGFVKIDKFIEIKSKVVTFTIVSQSITAAKDAVVTQGTSTGTLMVALSGDVTEVKVKQDNDNTTDFNSTVNLVIDTTITVTGSNITNAVTEEEKTYYGICRKKIKQSRYTNFKKKN